MPARLEPDPDRVLGFPVVAHTLAPHRPELEIDGDVPLALRKPETPAEAVVALAVRQPEPDLRRADEPVAEYRNPVAELPVDLPARRDMAAQIPPSPHTAADRPRHRYQRIVPRTIIAWSDSSPVSLRVPSRSRFRIGPSDQPTPARQVRPPPSASERPA